MACYCAVLREFRCFVFIGVTGKLCFVGVDLGFCFKAEKQ